MVHFSKSFKWVATDKGFRYNREVKTTGGKYHSGHPGTSFCHES